jgi:predicted CopG family antitoxin
MTRSIQLDDDAYTRLKEARRENESWSEVIKRLVRPKPSLPEVLSILRKFGPSAETLDAVDESVSRRRQPRKRGA